jgi:hypothetical protein
MTTISQKTPNLLLQPPRKHLVVFELREALQRELDIPMRTQAPDQVHVRQRSASCRRRQSVSATVVVATCPATAAAAAASTAADVGRDSRTSWGTRRGRQRRRAHAGPRLAEASVVVGSIGVCIATAIRK